MRFRGAAKIADTRTRRCLECGTDAVSEGSGVTRFEEYPSGLSHPRRRAVPAPTKVPRAPVWAKCDALTTRAKAGDTCGVDLAPTETVLDGVAAPMAWLGPAREPRP
jgi:hypothetical protein